MLTLDWVQTLGSSRAGFSRTRATVNSFNHHATEELLTTKGLTKFGSVDQLNHLYAHSEPNRERNSIDRKGGRFMLGSDGHQRLCVFISDSQRKVGQAHVLVNSKVFLRPGFRTGPARLCTGVEEPGGAWSTLLPHGSVFCGKGDLSRLWDIQVNLRHRNRGGTVGRCSSGCRHT